MADDRRVPFADAERFELEDEGKKQVWVLLALTERGGKSYGLLAPEDELGGGEGDMAVMVFEYRRDDDGERSLHDISDESLYESLYAEFAETMGLESSDSN